MSFIVEGSLFVLAAVCSFLYYVNNKQLFSKNRSDITETPFLRKYLVMYIFAVAADWIQGPYTYDLYTAHGFSWNQIATFYMISFLSSAISGSFLGVVSDWLGHRVSAIAYCAIYALGALLKTSSSPFAQVCSSLLGGVACTLLYTVFDSWLVAEHNYAKATAATLSRSFSLESACSSVTAIVAGICGSILVDKKGGFGLGPRAPFVAAAIILVPCAACVLHTMRPRASPQSSSSLNSDDGIKTLLRKAWSYLLGSGKARLVCATQALYESSMYIFVILWTPVIRGQCTTSETYLSTLGWIFSAFMVAMTTGSQVYSYCNAKKIDPITIASSCFIVAAFSLFLPTLVQRINPDCPNAGAGTVAVFFSFMVFEGTCGMYYPIINDFKAKYFPSEFRTGLMSIARVGQNIIIIAVLLSSNLVSNAFMLFVASVSLVGASLLQYLLCDVPAAESVVPQDEAEKDEKATN